MNRQPGSSLSFPACRRVAVASIGSATLLLFVLASAARVNAQQPGWSMTGDLNTGRFGHSVTRLDNNKVLVVGGRICPTNTSCTDFSSSELYDPATGTWSATGSLGVPRHAHIAVRLMNGKVLVAGGHNLGTNWDTAELYDPATNNWTATGNLGAARSFATATLLPNGKVLVTGGGAGNTFLNTAELYDPAAGGWSPAGTMNAVRGFHTATLLADGRVLVASGASLISGNLAMNQSSEVYDPANGSWTPTGNLATARVFHTENMLPNGKVLVAGGSNFISVVYDTAELYDPATGQWTATGKLTTPRISHTATLLQNGRVLAAAGNNNDAVNFTQRSAELYNPETGSWTPTAQLNVVRGNHQATLLADGRVLVSGGNGGGSAGLASAELFDGTTAVPEITGASISGKKLIVQGKGFDDGADLFINDVKQKKTANDELTPTTSLIASKSGKKIGRGETVRLKVRNSEGTESAEFNYTRPVL